MWSVQPLGNTRGQDCLKSSIAVRTLNLQTQVCRGLAPLWNIVGLWQPYSSPLWDGAGWNHPQAYKICSTSCGILRTFGGMVDFGREGKFPPDCLCFHETRSVIWLNFPLLTGDGCKYPCPTCLSFLSEVSSFKVGSSQLLFLFMILYITWPLP